MENFTNPNTTAPDPFNTVPGTVPAAAPVSVQSTVTTSTPLTSTPPMTNPNMMGGDMPPTGSDPVVTAPKKSNMMSMILIFVLLIILGFGAWMYFGRKNIEPDPMVNNLPTPMVTEEITMTVTPMPTFEPTTAPTIIMDPNTDPTIDPSIDPPATTEPTIPEGFEMTPSTTLGM